MPQQLKPGEMPSQGQGPRTQDYQPVSLSHPDAAPIAPAGTPGPFAPRPPARQAQQAPQQPQYETVPTQGGTPVEPTSMMTAEQYMQQADAPLQVPQAPPPPPVMRTQGAPVGARVTHPKQRSAALEALHTVFGLQGMPTETIDLGKGITLTFRPLGKEDQVWALDMAASFNYESPAARDRAFNIATATMSVAALNGKPLYDVVSVDVSGIPIRDTMNPPTLVRYNAATKFFYMVEGEGEDALAPIFADLLIEHWSTYQDRIGAKYSPFYEELRRLRLERAERERKLISGPEETSQPTSTSAETSQQG